MLPANLRLYEKFSVTKIEALTNANKIIIPIRRNLEFLTQVFPTKKLPPRKILILQDTYCIYVFRPGKLKYRLLMNEII